jgi:hypothetical protein
VAKERLRLLEAKMLRQQPVRQPLFPGGWFAECHEAELTGTNGCFTRHSQLVNREIGSEPEDIETSKPAAGTYFLTNSGMLYLYL